MTFDKASPQSAATTILLFGDQTESWVDGLDHLCRQAASLPWLQSFLDQMATTIKAEASAISIDREMRESLGHFSSLQELGQRYRHSTDELGVVRCLLLHTVAAGTLLQWVKREPRLIGPGARTEWVGISGGLLSLCALAIAEDFETLSRACLEVGRMLVRICKLASVRSRAIEDQPGSWGWAVLGISSDELRKSLEQFQQHHGIPPMKRAQVAVVGAGWNTVIGPPSILQLFMDECPKVKDLAKNPMEIKALQHVLELSSADIDFLASSNSDLSSRRICCPDNALWGMDDPKAFYANWGELLRHVCMQVLTRPLDVTDVVGDLSSKLGGTDSVRIVQAGTSSHAAYVASVLKQSGTEVSIKDYDHIDSADDATISSTAGRVAIIGMAGRGPGASNVDEFWEVIMSKQDRCTEVPKERFDVDDFYCPVHERGDQKCKMSTRYGCFMDNPGHFDSRFFHISPREAMLMDPGHRQFLMSAYEAMEMAGYSDGPTRTTDPKRIATFFTQCTDEWLQNIHPSLGCDSYTLQGVQRAFGPGRLAWQFKWEGPTYSLDSACAGTSAELHLACMSLLTKDIDMAIAGGSNVLSWPHTFTCLSDAGVLSDTGNCKPFRDDADGYCKADFVGAVALKRLEDAVAHNDNVLAVIASSGRNHSGNSTSITTSDAAAQERLFQKVMRNAQVLPNDIAYVEMHGTGTQIGDPAEMGAVANTFKHRSRVHGPLPIGGVKANVGHSEAAAGMSELLKCIMMFQTNTIPPQAGMPHPLNPKFPKLSEINIEIPSEPKPFEKNTKQPRRILLNNFDAAGGNACMILEDYTPSQSHGAADPRSTHVIATSARTKTSFEANKKNLVSWLKQNQACRIEDVAYTTTARRMQHPFRFACAASSVPDLIKQLEASDHSPSPVSQSSPVVFVFTGQGSHYAGMGAELYCTSPVFRATVDLCVTICDANHFPSFLDVIAQDDIDVSKKDTAQIQLAVVTLEIALVAFWRSIGVEPTMVTGHSLGEYAALYTAGVLSLADTLYLVGNRARILKERCEPGSCAMLAVSASEATLQQLLARNPESTCAVACINSPSATVISGTAEDLAWFEKVVKAQDAKTRTTMLSVPYAFHSFQMDPILEEYTALASGITFAAPRIPVASTLLGSIVEKAGIFRPEYLAQQTRHPVDFVSALHAINSRLKSAMYIEIGPAPVCTSFVRGALSPPPTRILHSIEAKTSNWKSISNTLSSAYLSNVEIDWLAFHRPFERHLELQRLPSYLWDMKNYWLTWTERVQGSISEQPPIVAAAEPYYTTFAQYVVSKSSSPHISVTFRARIGDPDLLAVIDGHKMQQVGLASGSAFCEAALAVAKYALEHNGRENITAQSLTCHDPVLLAPLTRDTVGLDGELLTTAVMESFSSDVVSVSFKATSANASHDMGSITVKLADPEKTQTDWDRMSFFVHEKMQERITLAKNGVGHRLQPDVFYALFDNAVEFSSAFRGVQEAYIAPDFQEAAAVVKLPNEPATSRFVQSPYWSEALAHLAGFMVNGNPSKSARLTFMVMGFDSAQQTVTFEKEKQYLTYTRIAHWDKDVAYCDAFVFELESKKMVMQLRNLRYQQLPAATWRHILQGAHGSPVKSTSNSPTQTIPIQATDEDVVSIKTAAKTRKKDMQATTAHKNADTADSGLFDRVLESIIKSTGSDPSDFTDESALGDLGVDSIMAIEIVSNVRTSTGIDLPAQFVFEYPTIGDLRRAFGTSLASQSAAEAKPDSSSAADTTLTPANLQSESSLTSRSSSSSTLSSSFVMAEKDVDETEKSSQEIVSRRLQLSVAQPKQDDTSPQPTVRLTLLQGRAGPGKAPFYLMADGTGSIGTYIHLPRFKSKMPVYGVDSPFLRCPSRLTSEVGIQGVARLIVEALLKAQPEGNFHIGGFSAGCMVAFEVCRQLGAASRKVDGLILIDLCCPRPTTLDEAAIMEESKVGVDVFKAAVASDGLWSTTANTEAHLDAYFLAMRLYNPPTMTDAERPAHMAVIWAEKGLINRVRGDAKVLEMLERNGIPTKSYPGYMEDPKLSPMACLVPDKTKGDLGPNGWEKYAGGEVLALSVPATHLDLPMPGNVHLLHKQLERAFDYFQH